MLSGHGKNKKIAPFPSAHETGETFFASRAPQTRKCPGVGRRQGVCRLSRTRYLAAAFSSIIPTSPAASVLPAPSSCMAHESAPASASASIISCDVPANIPCCTAAARTFLHLYFPSHAKTQCAVLAGGQGTECKLRVRPVGRVDGTHLARPQDEALPHHPLRPLRGRLRLVCPRALRSA